MQELDGVSVNLRRVSREYCTAYASMFSPTVQLLLHCTRQAEIDYLHECFRLQCTDFFYCIFIHDLLIGALQLRGHPYHTASLYGWLNEQYWGRGYYQEAVKVLVCYYFLTTHAYCIDARVDVTNKRSYYALKKCGFADSAVRPGPYGMQYELILRAQRIIQIPSCIHTLCSNTTE